MPPKRPTGPSLLIAFTIMATVGIVFQSYFYFTESPRFDSVKLLVKAVFLLVCLCVIYRRKATAANSLKNDI